MRIESRKVTSAFALVVTLVLALVRMAPAAEQQTFESPQQAVDAFLAAAREGDVAKLTAIFGPDSDALFDSGDEVADAAARGRFVSAAQKDTELVPHGDEMIEVVVGDNHWPLPIPLVKTNGAWHFDTAEGKEELVNRRIGSNELSAIDVCHAFVDAQLAYASKDRDGDGVKEFAQKIRSDPGTQDGLFWKAADFKGEASPIGPLAATAAEEGYRLKNSGPTPYHGYYFRLLKAQGAHAPGGKTSYLVGKNMTRGFALVAVPAEYGSSGVMTFLINRNDILFQKDLGKDTARLAADISAYDPDDTWTVVKE